MFRRFVNDYLSYTYKERIGIFIISGFILLLIFIPFLFPYFVHTKHYDHTKFDNEIAQLKVQQTDSPYVKKYNNNYSNEDNYAVFAEPTEKNYFTKENAEVFKFDPNTATPAEWKRLGIKDKTIATIQKYLSKGGHFYKPEDFSKIWGLHPEDIKRLLPYIIIADKKNDYAKANSYTTSFTKQTYTPKTFESVDINTADTTLFIALPGIGSKLAQRIINFRNKLGGFYSVDQVGETFGLPDSTYQKIKPRLLLRNSTLKKVNINTALPDEMKAHPYIRYALANAIIQYRTQHGNFSSVNDLKKIMIVTDDIYKKAEPYLTVGE